MKAIGMDTLRGGRRFSNGFAAQAAQSLAMPGDVPSRPSRQCFPSVWKASDGVNGYSYEELRIGSSSVIQLIDDTNYWNGTNTTRAGEPAWPHASRINQSCARCRPLPVQQGLYAFWQFTNWRRLESRLLIIGHAGSQYGR
ncbi:hypothetical protein VSR68_39370 [Paraburkholderia phymatum]|uniref:hypothetical protein n=1 Tax=Paraburkholderia phymatum TaxID=148447 RepID=UPI00318157F8